MKVNETAILSDIYQKQKRKRFREPNPRASERESSALPTEPPALVSGHLKKPYQASQRVKELEGLFRQKPF